MRRLMEGVILNVPVNRRGWMLDGGRKNRNGAED